MMNAAPVLVKNAPVHFMYGLLRQHNKLEGLAAKQTSIFESIIDTNFKEMARLEEEKKGKMLERGAALISEKRWSFLSNVAQSVVSGSAALLGSLQISQNSATPASYLMVASGITSVANRMLHSTGIYTKAASWIAKTAEMKEKIASRLETGMTFLSMGFALAGGAMAAKSSIPSMSDAPGKLQSAISGIATLAGLGRGATDVQRSFIQRQGDHLSAFIQTAETKIMLLYYAIHRGCKEVDHLANSMNDIGENLKNAISGLSKH